MPKFAHAMINDLPQQRSSRPVAIWLLVGVFMIMIQVILGGITRLTGSGLSITEWKPIMGALPPMNETDWNLAFDKYKQIAQFKYVNAHFTLSDFKFIFFWEWFHRLWARLLGVAFAIPFIIFIIQRRFKKEMIRPLVILFILGGIQGLVGWIMVESGLEGSELLYVSHFKLAIHFILALGLLCYALWFALKLLIPENKRIVNGSLNRFTKWIIAILVIQLIYGAFMAGLKLAAAAATWPEMNGEWLPHNVHEYGSRTYGGLSFLVSHPMVIHFIHRNLAYIIFILIVTWTMKALYGQVARVSSFFMLAPLILVFIQVLLGITALLNATNPHTFLWIAIGHQFVAMLLLLSLIWMLYIIKGK